MKFEEDFPSLLQYVIEDKIEADDDWNRYKVSIGDVQKHCLDKQQVKDAFGEVMLNIYKNEGLNLQSEFHYFYELLNLGESK